MYNIHGNHRIVDTDPIEGRDRKPMTGRGRNLIPLALIVATSLCTIQITGCEGEVHAPGEPNRFELMRTHVAAWLAEAGADKPIKTAEYLKETILDNWESKKESWQIVSFRTQADYDSAGHVPNAIRAGWRQLAAGDLAGLNREKKTFVYCYTGHTGQLAITVLGLLGHEGYNLKFGMMDWNLGAMADDPWDMIADYEVETGVNTPEERFRFPVIRSEHADPLDAIREAAAEYLSEAEVVIKPAEVRDILDNWESNKFQYQIVSVRKLQDYEAGHIPHAINIPWSQLADSTNLARLDPGKTTIVYCYAGPTGQIASTVLNILGYKAINLKFGMMDWNSALVNEEMLWDGVADYPVELADYLK